MAFPTIEGQQTTADSGVGGAAGTGSTAANSHAITLPSTVSAGSLLMVLGRVAGAGTVSATGWTVNQDSSDASDDVSFWAYRDTLAVGNEDGTTVTFNHGATLRMVAVSLSITGAEDPATRAPEASTVAVGTSTTPNPTTCTPTGGAKDYLWLYHASWDGEQVLNKTAVTNYGTGDVDISCGSAGGTTLNCQLKFGSRQLNAASEDAPAMSAMSVAPTGWTAWVIAVHPGTPLQTGTALTATVAASTAAPAGTGSGTATSTAGTSSVATTGVVLSGTGTGTVTLIAASSSVVVSSIDASSSNGEEVLPTIIFNNFLSVSVSSGLSMGEKAGFR